METSPHPQTPGPLPIWDLYMFFTFRQVFVPDPWSCPIWDVHMLLHSSPTPGPVPFGTWISFYMFRPVFIPDPFLHLAQSPLGLVCFYTLKPVFIPNTWSRPHFGLVYLSTCCDPSSPDTWSRLIWDLYMFLHLHKLYMHICIILLTGYSEG